MEDLSSITNRWDDPSTRIPLEADHVRVFQAGAGEAYNHHGHITWAFETLYASWSNGVVNEDRAGQHTRFAVSTDMGRSWSDARPLVSPWPGRYEAAILTNNGILPSWSLHWSRMRPRTMSACTGARSTSLHERRSCARTWKNTSGRAGRYSIEAETSW